MIKFWFDRFDINRASHRLRIYKPVHYLKSEGYDVDIITPDKINQINKNDIVIFSKDSKLESMRKIKSLGYKVGFDLCDNKFASQDNIYYDYCKEVDFITVNSKTMADVVFEETGKKSYFFADTLDREIKEVKTRNSQLPLKVLWYGGISSLAYFDFPSVLNALESLKVPYEFRLITNKVNKYQTKFLRRYQKNPDLLAKTFNLNKVKFYEWNYDLQGELMDWTDIVCIPVKDHGGKKGYSRIKTKSTNRVSDALAYGKWVITTDLPSYKQLVNYTWQDNYVKGFEKYLNDYDDVARRINLGQEWLLNTVTPKVVGKQLKKIYKKVTNE